MRSARYLTCIMMSFAAEGRLPQEQHMQASTPLPDADGVIDLEVSALI